MGFFASLSLSLSIRPSVHPSIHPSIHPSARKKWTKLGNLIIRQIRKTSNNSSPGEKKKIQTTISLFEFFSAQVEKQQRHGRSIPVKSKLIKRLSNTLKKDGNLNVNVVLAYKFSIIKSGEILEGIKFFNTRNEPILPSTDIK